jgi:RNA polymerase sigma-70 factor (ECF subfamily)
VALRKTDLYQHESGHSRREPATNLMGLIMKGDEAAFRLFHTATNGLLFAILLRILSHTQIAEEVLSELYDEVKLKAGRFSRQNEQPVTWLILIAHRRAVERLCRQLTIQGTLQSGTRIKSATAGDSFINITEQRRLIRAALNSIPHQQQRMIELAFFSGMSNSEIAMELGESCEVVDDGLRSGMLRFFCGLKSLGFSPETRKVNPTRRHPRSMIKPGAQSTRSRYVW